MLVVAATLPTVAMAQFFHGAAVQKQCAPLGKVGDTTNCLIRVANIDQFGDSVDVLEAFDIINPGPTEVRVPALGNLPIVQVDAGVTCAAGPSLPCTIPGAAGPTGSGLGVTFQSNEHVIQPGDPDPLPDQGRALVSDNCDDPGTTGCSSIPNIVQFTAATNIFTPAIAVAKAANPTLAKVGDTVDYTITLTNGSSPDTPPLTCTATDPLLGGPIFGPAVLPPGDTVIPVSRDVMAGDPNPLTNTVTLNCAVDGFTNTLTDEASVDVAVFEPLIDVAKTANPTRAKVGDTVDYTITLSNNSSAGTPDLNCTATDPLLGGVVFGPAVLPPGDTVIPVSRDVMAGDPNPLTNTVTLDCNVVGFANMLSDNASVDVAVFEPAIDVAKVANPTVAKVGDTVDYTITLTNDSSAGTPDLNCTATDPLLGGAIFGPAVLPPGDTVIPVSRDVMAGDPNPLVNTVTLDCSVAGFTNTLTDEASASVDLFEAAIDVTKVADPTVAKVGDTVDYTITLSNNSDPGTPDLNCTATDPLLGGAIFGPAVLPLGDTVIPVSRDVMAGDPDPLINTVTLSCTVDGLPNVLDDTASAEVDLVNPAVELTKVCAPDPVSVGEDITWTITIDNTGDVDLDCILDDTTAGIVALPVAVAAGTAEDVVESRAVMAGDAPVISNTASVACMLDAALGLPNVLDDEAMDDCEVLNVEAICRTPGFWATHACGPDGIACEKRRSQNITQAVIDAGGGSLQICGQTVDNTSVGNMMSALEAMCVSPQGEQRLQLARQLTAAALNCVISGAGEDCAGLAGVDTLFASCNAACGDPLVDIGSCIEDLDDFNNGITAPGCHDRPLVNDALGLDFDPPGPAGSSKACNAANSNNITILP